MSLKNTSKMWIAANEKGDTFGPSTSFLGEEECKSHAAQMMFTRWGYLERKGWTVKTGKITMDKKP